MARPKKNTVDYFPHPVTHGKKMSYIEKKYGNDGYAMWFKILEEIGSTDNHYLDLNDNITMMFLIDKCNVEEERINEFLSDLVKLQEIDKELFETYKLVYSTKFIDNVADVYQKRKSKLRTLEEFKQVLSTNINEPTNS